MPFIVRMNVCRHGRLHGYESQKRHGLSCDKCRCQWQLREEHSDEYCSKHRRLSTNQCQDTYTDKEMDRSTKVFAVE